MIDIFTRMGGLEEAPCMPLFTLHQNTGGGVGGEEEKRGKEEECAVYCALCKLQDPLEVVCFPSFLTCCFMD